MSKFSPESHPENDRLELALRASNEGIWDWIIKDQNIYYSDRILDFFKHTEESAPNIFLPPYLSIHHQDRPDFVIAIDEALKPKGQETLAVDTRVQTGDGNWRWLRIRGTVVRNDIGVATRIAGSMIDISLRKKAEAQIEEERHLLRSLIDHVPLQVYFKDLDSNLVMTNRGMAEYHGFDSSEEMVGKHDSDLFSNDHWEKAVADEQRIIKTGIPMTGQLERETWREGDETYVVTSKFPWRDKSGSIRGTFGVSSDVTSLVMAQRQATELANELQKKNIEYEEEVKLAREIQQALSVSNFSPASNEAGIELGFGSRYLPISGLAGDFYDIIHLENNRYGLFICDVMGHGVRAALVVSMLRGLLATQSSEKREPSEFLQKLNDGLSSILKRANVTMFATAFYGVLDLDGDTMTYSCAGHPGPVISSKNGSTQLCNNRSERGPALGLIAGAQYPKGGLELSKIERILLFTDGVLEAENEHGEQFMETRLLKIVEKEKTEDIDGWLDGIINTVLEFSDDHHFDDDVCLLGVQINRVISEAQG
ncbi:MAG: SpoIIE family protein phosphatase [Akkermansiaceae bacterium]